ncbi:MAG: hypothetical protein J0L92_26620 [Deltaproteobacteria bacterium]|nr:hypothetical protein [Deltaproteobacteria bacterium]
MPKFKRRVTGKEVSRQTLLLTPGRAFQFLMGINNLPTVRELMTTLGFDESERERGWDLLRTVGMRPRPDRLTDVDVRNAVTAIDQWDERAFVFIDSAFTRHPDAHAAVLKDLAPIAGDGAVMNADTLLRRLADLEKTEEGRAALAALAKKGLGEAERKRIAGLVEVAMGKGKMIAATTLTDAEAAHEEALLDLRDWYTEWAEIARFSVKRRDYLITLGLAERRSGDLDPLDVVDPPPFVDPTEDPTEEPTDPNKPSR